MSDIITSPDKDNSKEINNLNRWLSILVVFIVLWTVGMIVYIEKKTDDALNRPIPIVLFDTSTGKLNNTAYNGLFPNGINQFFINEKTNNNTGKSVIPNLTNVISNPLFEQKKSYAVGDFVIVNYLHKEGVIIEKRSDNKYLLLYNVNGDPKTIELPGWILIYPTSDRGIDPFSLVR
jgi:hypothetical protein